MSTVIFFPVVDNIGVVGSMAAALKKSNKVTKRNLITEAILTELSKEILNGNQVAAILGNPCEFPGKLIEELSLVTALRYWNGQMTYNEGDCIMNNLYIYWTTNKGLEKQYDFPSVAWECYLAFDAGEFYRGHDDKSIDPSEKYTRPLVESLLSKTSK